MRTISDEAIAALIRADRHETARLVTLTSDLVPVAEYAGDEAILLEGQVSDDLTRQTHQTMTARIDNAAGAHTPADLRAEFAALGTVALDWGIRLPSGDTEWLRLMTARLDSPKIAASAGSSIALTGSDRTSILAVRPRKTMTWSGRVADVVRAIAETAGMGSADHLYALDDGGAILAAPVTEGEEQDGLSFLGSICADHALVLWCDPYGTLTLAPAPDPDLLPVSWDLVRGDEGLLLELVRDPWPALPVNRETVIGESSVGGPYRGEARDLDPASPTYNPTDGSGPVGDRPGAIFRTALVTSREQAYRVAVQRLAAAQRQADQVTATIVPIPCLEAGDVVRIDDEITGASGRYRLTSITTPLGLASASFVANGVRRIG